jgi:alkanesulfonate monooxygenase SsuD/methylene tetrahydromethanopterin reductase-like flavin-dependent oxidoreductase (luciferase family)
VRDAASAAGRDPEALELSSLTFVVALTDDPAPIREQLAQHNRMTVDDVTGCPLFLTGSGAEIRDRLHAQREETGISYVVVQGRDPQLLERFAAEVVTPLAGT